MTSALANFLSLIYYSPLYNSSYMWIFPYNRLLKYAIQSVCSLFLPLASCSFPHSHIHAHLHTLYSHTRILCNNNWPDIEWHVSRDGWSLEGNSLIKSYLFLFFKDFIYLFLERGERRETERERHQCVVTSHMHTLLGTWPATQAWALTGNRTGDPLVGSPALNPLSQSSHGKSYFFYLTYFYYKICMDMI